MRQSKNVSPSQVVILLKARSDSPVEEAQGRRAPQTGFRADIEGLRAIAVVGVVLFHADVPGVGGGYVGVDVFFVISGFLITGLLWREVSTTGTIELRPFYGARARRLLPASALVGVVTAICSVLLLPPLRVPNVLDDGLWSALYVGNYRFALQFRNYFDTKLPASPFQHYWSLGVEEQFYVVWPALIIGTAWLIRRVGRRHSAGTEPSRRPYLAVLALIAAASFALSLVISYVVPCVAFYSLPTRAWQLGLGGLVALTAGRLHRLPAFAAAIAGWSGLALIVVAYLILSPTSIYPGIAALLPAIGTALVIGGGCAGPPRGCGRLLELPRMRAVGRVSYSWYLWHWPVLVFAPALLGHPFGLASRFAAVLVSAGLAVLTLHLIENPLRFAPLLRRSALSSLVLGGAATALAACVCVALPAVVPTPVGRGAPTPALSVTATPRPAGPDIAAYDAAVQRAFAQVHAAVVTSAGLRAVPSNLDPPLSDVAAELVPMFLNGCMRTFFQAGQPECVMGDTAAATRVALVGDSNAAMWAPAVQQVAVQRHWRLEILNKAACPLMDLPVTNPLRRILTKCDQWRDQVIARLRVERPRLVLLSLWRGYGPGGGYLPGFAAYDPAWLTSLTRLVEQLRGFGAEVLVLGPIPDPKLVARICLSGHLDDATLCSSPKSTAVNTAGITAESVATKGGGGQYADLTELFCTADRCPVIVGNTLVYFDEDHLTAEYPRVLAPVIGALADRALAGG